MTNIINFGNKSFMYGKHIDKTFNNFTINNKNKEAVEKCGDFLNKKDINIYLWGRAGYGKTHLLCAVANEVRKAERILFYRMIDFLNMIRERIVANDNEIIRDLLDSEKPFFIDDFGTEKLTEFVFEKVYDFFDLVEVMERKKIMITSNYSISEIMGRVSDRIASRIVGNFEVVKIGGEDRRVKQ
ncbi:MAG: Chromosomal replication initiator protein DnaA [candidate division WS2 bacterium]|nr:Chromosomal replication initiator protein DnaA [Candidatus Lithacetigena glycinireducens]